MTGTVVGHHLVRDADILPAPLYVNEAILTSSKGAQTITIPDTASFVAITANKDAYVRWDGGAASVPAETAEVTNITVVADDESSLLDTYFTIDAALDGTEYYVWYDVGAAGTDPAIEGHTGIDVEISEDATAGGVAEATFAAIDAVEASFAATDNASVVTVTNAANGETTDAADGAVPTGFTFAVTTQGKMNTNNGEGSELIPAGAVVMHRLTPGTSRTLSANAGADGTMVTFSFFA